MFVWEPLIVIDWSDTVAMIHITISHKWLTHWSPVTHTCVSKLSNIGSDNGLSPARRQAIIWTNARILLIGPLETNFSEILTEIMTFSFKKMYLKASSAKLRPFCFGLNVLTRQPCLHYFPTLDSKYKFFRGTYWENNCVYYPRRTPTHRKKV